MRGRFVDSAGNPLQGVRVSALPVEDFRLAKISAAASGAVDTATTDGSGRYALPSLSSGEYNLVGEYGDGELAVLVPEVSYRESEGMLELGQDTLLAPGSIRGRVLWGGRGKEGVLAYLPGTSFLGVSDSAGAFRVSGVPAGRYRVNYLVPGFHAAADTGVDVRAGLTARLPDKVLGYDASLAPPAPTGPRATLDTVRGVVRLEWDRVPVEDLLGYLVYRDSGLASVPVLLTSRIHPETSFVDSLKEEEWAGRWSMKVTYRIRSVDMDKNPSLNFSPPLTLEAARRLRSPTNLGVEFSGLNGNGQAWKGDSVTMVLRFHNGMQPVREIAWKAEGIPPLSESVAVSGREGMISRRVSWSGAGTVVLSVEAVDSVGDTTRILHHLQVVEGVPVAYAGADTTVSPGDSVHLTGKDWDGFGPVVLREWDVGATGMFVPAPEGRHSFAAPAGEGEVACVFRVVDVEGLHASDTLMVYVVPDLPTARVTGPLNAFPGDTVRLSGATSSDGFGRIVAWEWDIGGSGRFSASSGPDTAFVASGEGSAINCVLRVTDEDGKSSTAVIRVGLGGGGQWIQVVGDAPFSAIGKINAWERDGMLWVEGALSESPDRSKHGIWRSPDMINWTKVEPDTAGWEWPNLEHVEAVDGDRLVAISPGYGDRQPVPGDPPLRVLTTLDARTWSELSAPSSFWDRSFSSRVALNGNLYFLGAFVAAGIGPVGEVWSTRDWREVARITDRPAFGIRGGMAVAAKDGRLWIYGGIVEEQAPIRRVMNDVWSSSDGIGWTRVTDSALAQPSYGRALVAHGNDLWLFGGYDGVTQTKSRDVWRSRDGVRWTRDPSLLPDVDGLEHRRAVSFRGRVWMIASHSDRNGLLHAGIWAKP